jgi:hypothetical protein
VSDAVGGSPQVVVSDAVRGCPQTMVSASSQAIAPVSAG